MSSPATLPQFSFEYHHASRPENPFPPQIRCNPFIGVAGLVAATERLKQFSLPEKVNRVSIANLNNVRGGKKDCWDVLIPPTECFEHLRPANPLLCIPKAIVNPFAAQFELMVKNVRSILSGGGLFGPSGEALMFPLITYPGDRMVKETSFLLCQQEMQMFTGDNIVKNTEYQEAFFFHLSGILERMQPTLTSNNDLRAFTFLEDFYPESYRKPDTPRIMPNPATIVIPNSIALMDYPRKQDGGDIYLSADTAKHQKQDRKGVHTLTALVARRLQFYYGAPLFWDMHTEAAAIVSQVAIDEVKNNRARTHIGYSLTGGVFFRENESSLISL